MTGFAPNREIIGAAGNGCSYVLVGGKDREIEGDGSGPARAATPGGSIKRQRWKAKQWS